MNIQPSKSDLGTIIRRYSERQVFAVNQKIAQLGDKSPDLYFVVNGSVSLIQVDGEGKKEMVVNYIYPGEFFGSAEVCADRSHWHTSVVARVPCVCIVVSRESYHSLVTDYPQILHEIVRQMAAQLIISHEKNFELSFVNVFGRVQKDLLRLASEPGAKAHTDGVQIRITRLEIAKRIGCSREMVGRAMKELVRLNYIQAWGRNIVIHSDYYMHKNTENTWDRCR